MAAAQIVHTYQPMRLALALAAVACAQPAATRVTDRVTGAPIPGATVHGDGTVEAPGYLTARHVTGDVALPPAHPTDAQVRAMLHAHAPEHPPPLAAPVTSLPDTIRVWRRGLDGSTSSCSGRVDVLPLEDYVKGVLPHEWIPSWDANALQMGAVAIRTYAAYWVAAGGKYTCADLDDTTASQVYKDDTYVVTDAAVDATASVVIVDGSGALVFAEYSAENGDPTADGVDEPYCSGQTVNGHGHGTCQWGTQRWATNEAKDYVWMSAHYYPGASAQLISAPVPPTPEPDAAPAPSETDAGVVAPQQDGGGVTGGCSAAPSGGRRPVALAFVILSLVALTLALRRHDRH